MPHDTSDQEHWHEPSEAQKAGRGTFKRRPMAYDRFMEEQEIPIIRDFGIRRIHDLPLQPWSRMGGRGCFIQLFGTEGLWGCYVVEVPGGGALNPERHIYEEIFLVAEGRGTTEVWQDSEKKHVFEWQRGSMFAIPLNAHHRIVNASSSAALLIAGTSAPNPMNLYDNAAFIFDNSFVFNERYDGGDDYFKPNETISPDPVRGLAMRRANLLPDIVNCDIPLDNRRSPGYRRLEPHMAGNKFYCWLSQHETGRYSKAHKHDSGAVLICVQGKGYTYTWPSDLGPTPWRDGRAEDVIRIDYEQFGMVSAAPMSGDWFHQHFGISKGPLRMAIWAGANVSRSQKAGVPGKPTKDLGAIDMRDGGHAIPYDEEDPILRREFEATLAAEGSVSRMEDWLYTAPKPGEVRPMSEFAGI